MAKLLTLREMEIFRVAVSLAELLDPCNADIIATQKSMFGFSSKRATIAINIAKRLSFKIDEDDIAEICEEAGQ